MKKKKIIIGLFFMLMLIVTVIYFNMGSDYFWHLKMGEYIVKFKELPNICLYSWYGITNKLMFTLHEWLYEVIIYGFYKIYILFKFSANKRSVYGGKFFYF